MKDLAQYLGESRRAAIARELTKIHEEYIRGTLGELVQALSAKELRGEMVIIVEGASKQQEVTSEEILSALNDGKKKGMSTRDAVREVATVTGVSKRKVYELYLSSARN